MKKPIQWPEGSKFLRVCYRENSDQVLYLFKRRPSADKSSAWPGKHSAWSVVRALSCKHLTRGQKLLLPWKPSERIIVRKVRAEHTRTGEYIRIVRVSQRLCKVEDGIKPDTPLRCSVIYLILRIVGL